MKTTAPDSFRCCPRSLSLTALALISLAAAMGEAQAVVKADNGTAFEAGGSWVGGTAPGPADIAVFDAAFATTTLKPALSGNTSWLGIDTTAAAQNIAISQGGATTGTLTLGASGIIGNSSTSAGRSLSIASNILLAASQTWYIPDSSAVLDFGHLPAARSTPASLDLGGFTLNRTGTGRVNIYGGSTQPYTFTNGTMVVSSGVTEFRSQAAAATATSSLTVRVDSGATFMTSRGSGVSDTFFWNANLQLNGGTWDVNGVANALTIGGILSAQADSSIVYSVGTGTTSLTNSIGAPLTGSANLSVRNTSANPNHRLAFSGDNSGYSGTLSVNGTSGARLLRLASSTAGSAAATWNVDAGNTLEITAPNVTLGLLTGSGQVLLTGGSFTLANPAGSTFTGTLTAGSGGSISGSAALLGNVVIANGGSVAPGNSPGTLPLSGSFDLQTGGVYNAEIVSLASMDRISLSSPHACLPDPQWHHQTDPPVRFCPGGGQYL